MSHKKTDYAAAKTVSHDDIPIIDMAPLLQRQAFDEVAESLMAAALNTGFFYVNNHAIEVAIINAAMAASQVFFNSSADEKASVAVNQQQRGWLAPGMAKFSGARTHDLKEIFFYGPEHWSAALEARRDEILLIADNQWPAYCPSLMQAVLPYYTAVCQLGHQLLSAIAVGMGEAPDFFAQRYTSPLGRGQLVYYPSST